MGKKVWPVVDKDGNQLGYVFHCPGCKCGHMFDNVKWKFNGDLEKPTFTPSLLYPNHTPRCHLFVTDGKIRFLNDCGHELAGKTVEMEDV